MHYYDNNNNNNNNTTITVGCVTTQLVCMAAAAAATATALQLLEMQLADGWRQQDSFIPSFLPEIHVTCHELGSNPGKNKNNKPKTTISSSSSSSSKVQSLHWLTNFTHCLSVCSNWDSFFFFQSPSLISYFVWEKISPTKSLPSFFPFFQVLLPTLGTMSQEHAPVHRAGQQEISVTSSLPLLIPAEVPCPALPCPENCCISLGHNAEGCPKQQNMDVNCPNQQQNMDVNCPNQQNMDVNCQSNWTWMWIAQNNRTWMWIAKATEHGCELSKTTEHGCELSKTTEHGCELPKTIEHGCELPKQLNMDVNLSKTTEHGCELPKTKIVQTTSNELVNTIWTFLLSVYLSVHPFPKF